MMKTLRISLIAFVPVIFFFQSCSCNYDTNFEYYTGLRIDSRYKKLSTTCLDALGEGGSQVEFEISGQTNLESIIIELDSLLRLNRNEKGIIPIEKKGNMYSIDYYVKDGLTHVNYYFDAETGLGSYSFFED